MSFAAPLALTLLIPLAALLWAARAPGFGATAQLPGAWSRVVAPRFQRIVAARSDLAAAKTPLWRAALGALIIAALARPGVDVKEAEEFATLGGRVIVLDVGADLTRHRQFLDDLRRADPATATAVVAVSGDAYRITPFTTDRSHIDRYVRVLQADMMPRPGQKPHLGLARAERILEEGGYLARQIVFLSARRPPAELVAAPGAGAQRFVIGLEAAGDWAAWAEAQGAAVLDRDGAPDVAADLAAAARAAARAELPDARFELTPFLILLAAALWLLKFRRRAE